MKAQPKKAKLSAREKYEQLRSAHLETIADKLETILRSPLAEGEETYSFTSPSGMEWELRKLKPSVFAEAGIVPQELAVKFQILKKEGGGGDAALELLTLKDVARSIEFNSAAVRYICVNPRIVEKPTNDDEIAFDAVLPVDYEALLKEATSGGGAAERLGNFPRK